MRKWRLAGGAYALASAGLVAGPIYALLSVLGLGGRASASCAAAITIGAAAAVAPRLPRTIDDLARRWPLISAIWVILVIGGVFNTVRVSRFMRDPEATGSSVVPSDRFFLVHNCLTAYYRAGTLARDGVVNLYEPVHYWGDPKLDDDPVGHIGRFYVDLYEYPPPFLLAARGALAITANFATWRATWFALEALMVLAALWSLAVWIGGRDGLVVGLAVPLVFAAPPTLATLQIGNFQLAAFALSILALVALERQRQLLGAGLLSFVVLAKVFPGVILVYLLARRQFRALATIALAGAAFVGATVAVVGLRPFHSFISYQLPRMASGKAFPFLETFPPAVTVNNSIFGFVLKLRFLGVPHTSSKVASVVAWVYTFVVVGFAFAMGRRDGGSRLDRSTRWIVLLQLAALRSPFIPDVYAVFGPIWLIALSIPTVRTRGAVLLAGAWISVCLAAVILTVTRPMELNVRFALTALGQAVGLAVVIVALTRTSRRHSSSASLDQRKASVQPLPIRDDEPRRTDVGPDCGP